MAAYEKYKSLIGTKGGVAYRLADKEIEACHNATEMMQHPVFVNYMDLKAPVNSTSKEFFPVDQAMIQSWFLTAPKNFTMP